MADILYINIKNEKSIREYLEKQRGIKENQTELQAIKNAHSQQTKTPKGTSRRR
jgi:hypothetical protein